MKKLLSMLIVGLFTGLSFASANTINVAGNSYTSDSNITELNLTYNDSYPSSIDGTIDFGEAGQDSGDPSGDPYNTRYLLFYYECNTIPDFIGVGNGGNFSYGTNFTSLPFITSYNDFGTVNLMMSCNGYYEGVEGVISNYKAYISSSPITLVQNSGNGGNNGGSNSDNLLNPGVISSGVQSGVSAFTNGLGNLVPTLLLFGLPILVIVLFWNKVRSYLKRIFTRR